jgi:ubiquitin C-terminal hydrolase
MQKRDFSTNKLPKIPVTDSTLSSKLYSLTGLRIFQAKFMEDLRYPRPNPKTTNPPTPNNENNTQNAPGKLVLGQDGFTGKDRANEGRQVGDSRVREEKKEEGLVKLRQAERVRLLCGRPRGLRNLGNTCYM